MTFFMHQFKEALNPATRRELLQLTIGTVRAGTKLSLRVSLLNFGRGNGLVK